MELPKQLEILKDRKIWLCYPMIWNETKHNGVGGFDKPPVNPYSLYNGSSSDPESLATFDEAASRIGETACVRVKNHDELVRCEIVGVGIALSNTGIVGLDMDNVVDVERRVMTKEAHEIMSLLGSYTEISPSGKGLHILFEGTLPKGIKKIAKPKPDIFKTEKAEYQLFDSGYMTISGDAVSDCVMAPRTEQMTEVYDLYFRVVEPIDKPSNCRPDTVSTPSGASGYTYERWLDDVRKLSDAEILDRIFRSGSTGKRVQALYEGYTSDYGRDHSRADQALCTYLYGFTSDRDITERLFRSSKLYRNSGKSRGYIDLTLNKASSDCIQLVGHIEFTAEEKREYAKNKSTDAQPAASGKYGSFIRDRARKGGK